MKKSFIELENKQYVIMFLPAILLLVILGIVPVLSVYVISLLKWELFSLGDVNFVWFKNFYDLIKDIRFINSLKVQFMMGFGSVFLQISFGLLLALLFNSSFKLIRYFRIVAIIPHVLPPVVVGLIWLTLLTPSVSPINNTMIKLGLGNPEWLTDPSLALGALIVADAWWGFPFTTIIVLSALQSISADIIEASSIDGANRIQKNIYIVLPMISWSLILCAILRIIDSFKAFPLIFIMTNGGPGTSTEVTNYYAYNTAFQYGHLGYASAMSFTMFVVSALLSLVILKTNKSALYR